MEISLSFSLYKEERAVMIMKKALAIFVFALSILVVFICRSNGSFEEKTSNLSKKDAIELDLTESGTAKARSINDICVHEKPLTYKENMYDESGELAQYFQYEYDDLNRYKTIYHYQRDPNTLEMVLFDKEDFAYDEFFYYKNTTYVKDGGLVTRDIYDTHNNPVVSQIPNKTNDDATTATYTYDYPTDTEKKEEEYAYIGEGAYLCRYTIKTFNEYGDEDFIMTQRNNSITTKSSAYKYDAKGRKILLQETIADEYGGKTVHSVFETTYLYDYNGLLISEEEKYSLTEDTNYNLKKKKKRQYEYDKKGRLIKKTIWHNLESDYPENDKPVRVFEYLYE